MSLVKGVVAKVYETRKSVERAEKNLLFLISSSLGTRGCDLVVVGAIIMTNTKSLFFTQQAGDVEFCH